MDVENKRQYLLISDQQSREKCFFFNNRTSDIAGRSRSKKKYLDGIFLSPFIPPCSAGFPFFLSSSNTQASVRTWVMVSIILLPNLADVYSIYYHNLIFFPFYSLTLLFERCLCLSVHFFRTSLQFLFLLLPPPLLLSSFFLSFSLLFLRDKIHFNSSFPANHQ